MTINDIQNYLKAKEFDAYIITRNNMFIGQDVLDEENKIKELTGFTGSAGTLSRVLPCQKVHYEVKKK